MLPIYSSKKINLSKFSSNYESNKSKDEKKYNRIFFYHKNNENYYFEKKINPSIYFKLYIRIFFSLHKNIIKKKKKEM